MRKKRERENVEEKEVSDSIDKGVVVCVGVGRVNVIPEYRRK